MAYRRLTATEQDRVIAMHDSGMTQMAIAQVFGCNQTTISRTLHPQNRAKELARLRAYREANRETVNATARRGYRAWRDRDPERVSRLNRERNFRKKYGITVAEFDAMVVAQRGVCAICGTEGRELHIARTIKGDPNLTVDHDHATGAIRGLLCIDCNNLLGRAADDTDILYRAIEYLRAHRLTRLRVVA